jgi:hypothetical protein
MEFLGHIALTGVTVQNCTAETMGSGNAYGGGIYYDGTGSVSLTNCKISGNDAQGYNGGTGVGAGEGAGGGVCVYGASGVTLASDTFKSNEAIGGSNSGGVAKGGGLFVLNSVVTPVLYNDTFTANKAIGGGGSSNGVAIGGGVFSAQTNSISGNLTLVGGSITGNEAVGGTGTAGGGVYFTSKVYALSALLNSPTISSNSGGTGTAAQFDGVAVNFTPTFPAYLSATGTLTFALPAATEGQSYSASITAGLENISSATVTDSLTSSSSLGLIFSGSGSDQLTISGTPNGTGSVTFNVVATDSLGHTQELRYTLTVNPSLQPPNFTSADNATFTAGSPGKVTVAANGFPTPTLSERISDILPGGVTFNSATGVLSGTLAAGSGGVYTLHFTAANTVGSINQTFTLTVNQPPAITSGNGTRFTIGQHNSFLVTTNGFTRPTLIESGAPSGVTFTDNGNGTATLAGTPATQGTYQFSITAQNGIGSEFAQNFTLTVNPAPPPSPPTSPPPPTSPALQVPPLLAFFDSLLSGVETVNANGTETITDSIFGFPLLVATFDQSGKLVSVDMFGIDVTFFFLLL